MVILPKEKINLHLPNGSPLVASSKQRARSCWDRRRPRLLVTHQVRGGNQAGEDACGPSNKAPVRLKELLKGIS